VEANDLKLQLISKIYSIATRGVLFLFSSSILSSRWTGDRPQEESTTFGYKSDSKVDFFQIVYIYIYRFLPSSDSLCKYGNM
jgi:hypothetical protein